MADQQNRIAALTDTKKLARSARSTHSINAINESFGYTPGTRMGPAVVDALAFDLNNLGLGTEDPTTGGTSTKAEGKKKKKRKGKAVTTGNESDIDLSLSSGGEDPDNSRTRQLQAGLNNWDGGAIPTTTTGTTIVSKKRTAGGDAGDGAPTNVTGRRIKPLKVAK